MKFKKITLLLCVIILLSCQSTENKTQDLKLWYNQPARIWEEALPLGNGTTGAMVWGGVLTEHYSLNDHTLWSGEPDSGNVTDGPEILKRVREAIDKGDYEKAGKLWFSLYY